MIAFSHTRGTVINRNWPERSLDFFIHVKSFFVHELIKSTSAEHCFNLAEHCLYRIKLGTVAHIEHRCHVQLTVDVFNIWCHVNLQLIHEQKNGSRAHLSPHWSQIPDVIFSVHGSLLNPDVNNSPIIRNCSEGSPISDVYVFIIDCQIWVFSWILTWTYW